MPNSYPSPLTAEDISALETMARQALDSITVFGLAPLYVAVDHGDRAHPHAWLFLAWPATDKDARAATDILFGMLSVLGLVYFGSEMQVSSPAPFSRG